MMTRSWDFLFHNGMHTDWDTAGSKEVIQRSIPAFSIGCVLDMGCGNGLFLQRLVQEGYIQQAYGVDISTEAIRQGRIFNARELNINLFAEDFCHTLFPEAYFDGVISTCLAYSQHPLNGLLEADRVLKPGGWFRFMIPALEAYWDGEKQEEGYGMDRTFLPQWNLRRSTWERLFARTRLRITKTPAGAVHPDCFFFGEKVQ